MIISDSPQWRERYPDACIGALALYDVVNPEHTPAFEAHKQRVEADLRSRYAGLDRNQLKSNPTLAAYTAYYKTFKKTYHVQLQLESIVHKGKSIPKVAALVEAMFVEELENLLLTAGHDLDLVMGTPTVDVAAGDEIYVKLNGQAQILKAGDMYIRDDEGVLSSILYGPDQRTRISPATRRVLFTVYGPAGITHNQMQGHLEDIRDAVLMIAPDSRVDQIEVISGTPM